MNKSGNFDLVIFQIEGLIQPFESLEELKISCQCSTSTILFLLLHCPALKRLFVGNNAEMTNEILLQVTLTSISVVSMCSCLQILSVNPMKELEELEMGCGDNLDKSTLDILLNNCYNLRYF